MGVGVLVGGEWELREGWGNGECEEIWGKSSCIIFGGVLGVCVGGGGGAVR